MADENNIQDQGPGDPPATVMPPIDVNHRNFNASGQANPIVPSGNSPDVPNEEPGNLLPPQSAVSTQSTPDYKLWEQLNKTQLYTKSYPDFQKQFNNDQSVNKLYQGLNDSQLYTKSKDDFTNQFFSHLPTKDVQDAHAFVNDYLDSDKGKAAINSINRDTYYNNYYQQQQNAGTGKQDATFLAKNRPVMLPDVLQQNQNDYVTAMGQNVGMQRDALKKAQTLFPADRPKIDQAVYNIDANSRPHDQAAVKYYSDQIGAGKMSYDIDHKQINKPSGFIDDFFNKMKDHSDAIDGYNYLTTHSKDDQVKYLDDLDKNYDPDKPIPKAEGFASIGGMLGGSVSQMSQMGAGSIAARLAGASAPELAVPIAAITTMGMGSGIEDFHKTGFFNTTREVYRDLKQQHPDIDHQTLLDEARDQGTFGAATSMAQGLLMGEVGNKETGEFTPVRYKAGFKKALTDIGNNSIEKIKSIAPDAASQGGIAGLVKGIENVHQGKPAGQGVPEATASAALFMAGLGLLRSPNVSEGAKSNLNDGYASAPEGVVDNALANHVALGTMKPDQAASIKQEIDSHKVLTENKLDVTSPLTPEAELFISDVDAGNKPSVMTKNLEKIAKDNGIEAAEGEELTPQKVINGLKKRQQSVKLPDTFVSSKDKMDNLASGLTGSYKTMYDQDPEGFMKFVADQAHGGDVNQAEMLKPETGITRPLIDMATEKYPSHILSPKTETNGKAEETQTWQVDNSAGQQTALTDEIPGKGESIKPNSNLIQPNKDFQTWDMGDMSGKPEDEAAKKHLEGVVRSWNVKPAGESGEKFGDEFVQRVIPAFEKVLKTEPNNTTIVTHSSALKAMKVWDAMGRPDVTKLTDEQKSQFANEYNKEETHNADLETFKGANGDIHVIRHGQTEDNAKNNFRSGDTNLTKKGIQQAADVGQELKRKTGGNVPKIITSDLPRAVHTSNLITDELNNKPGISVIKPKENNSPNIVNSNSNAIPEQTAGKMGIRNGSAVREEMGGSNKPVKPTEESIQPEETAENQDQGEGQRIGGIAQKVQETQGLRDYEPGKGWNKEEALEFGRNEIKKGTDPEKIFTDPKSTDLDLDGKLAVAQAHAIDLTKAMHDVGDKFGTDSEQFKAAQNKLADYQKLVQPAKTASSKAFTAQQGEYDVDLNSFTSVGAKIKDNTGKEPTTEQSRQIKELTQKNKDLTNNVSDLEKKLTEATNKATDTGKTKSTTYKDKAKAYADAFRKLKTKSFTFKDENGNDIDVTKAGIGWNDVVEAGAKIIEKTGEIADGVAEVIKNIKDADWYKGLSDSDKDKFATQLEQHYQENAPEIAVEKTQDPTKLAEQFINKKGNKFTPEESKNIWEYGKTNYLSKGIGFRDMIIGVSKDTGLSFDQVSHAIITPKTKPISDEMWKSRYDLEKNRIATRNYINKQGQNKAIRTFNNVVNIFREESVFGHGGVFVGTHAGMTLMDLPRAKHTVKAFFNAYKLAYGKTADYERAMEGLKNSKNYVLAQRSGLQNNPDIISNDSEVITSKLGKISETGKRGFNAIKILRQALFDSHYNSLSDAEKADPSSAVSIARLVNNATGATNLKLPPWFKEVTFAGGMEAARWGKLTRNPAEATSTALKALFDPKNTPIGDRVFAKVWARRVGTELATYSGMLMLNAALHNEANGDKENVNITDPTKSDWLKMKIGNTTLDFTSGMLSTLNFAKKMIYQPLSDSKGNIVEKEGETAFKYGMGKLSPFYSTAGEALLKHDYSGNTMPWSDAKPLHKYNHQMTWAEYGESKLPLPVAEGFNAFYESANQNGLDKARLDDILTGLKHGIISGTTGVRTYETEPGKKEETTPSEPLIPTNYK